MLGELTECATESSRSLCEDGLIFRAGRGISKIDGPSDFVEARTGLTRLLGKASIEHLPLLRRQYSLDPKRAFGQLYTRSVWEDRSERFHCVLNRSPAFIEVSKNLLIKA